MAMALMADGGSTVVVHPLFPAMACSSELGYNILVVQRRSSVRSELQWCAVKLGHVHGMAAAKEWQCTASFRCWCANVG